MRRSVRGEVVAATFDRAPQDHTALAATCLGHLARVYGQLDEGRVVAALRQARARPHVAGTAANALDDIELFLHPRRGA